MSRVGKVVVIKTLKQKHHQQWQPLNFTGIILSEDKKTIQILGNDGVGINIFKKDIFEILEKE